MQVDPRTALYHSSQPWPFPQSLMIGFIAEAAQAPDATGPGAAAAPQRRGLNLLAGPGAVAACDVGLLPSEAQRYLLPRLPAIQARCAMQMCGALSTLPLPAAVCRMLA